MPPRQLRPADRLVIHGEPIDFRELCRRAVPPETRYLVLDLDRTLHLGRNMGELLGWEVAAWHAYGRDRLAEAEPRRKPGRFFLDGRHPLSTLHYLAIGARMWAAPGLFYLFCGKIPGAFEAGRRWTFRAFGSDPVAEVQRIPQTALLSQLAALPDDDLRVLARRVWDRHACDQVIERDDVEWLRARCPGITVVLASASPRPTLEVAAEALGADDWIGSTLARINSSRGKLENLVARHPALADPATVSVGMTDTGYGEDHCWTDLFTRVVDVNSTSPFPPLVPAASPLREVHSAAVLTRRERARRAAGDGRWLDPRRPPREARDRVFTAGELAAALAGIAEEADRLAARLEERARGVAAARDAAFRRFADVLARVEETARAVDRAPAPERPALLARLERALREDRTVRRELARLERPIADVACAMRGLLAESRRALGAPADGGKAHAA